MFPPSVTYRFVFLYFMHFVTNRGAAKMSGNIAGFLSTGYNSLCKPPATGHPRRKYSCFPSVIKQTSRCFQNSLSCHFILSQLNSTKWHLSRYLSQLYNLSLYAASKGHITTSTARHLVSLGPDVNGQTSLQTPRLVTVAEGLAHWVCSRPGA